MMPGVVVAPFPDCLHCVAQPSGGYGLPPCAPPFGDYAARRCCGNPLSALEWTLRTHSHPGETAAVLVEPIQGEGGTVVPPPGFLPGLRALCDEHGMLLIVDEVQAGVGRTGEWWGHQALGEAPVAPDLLLAAKGLGSGLPIAAVAGRPELFARLAPGTLGGTYGGSAVASAAAAATLAVIREEGLLANAAARGRQLQAGLLRLAEEFPILDVRGRGLMVAVELGAEGGGPAAAGAAGRVTAAALQRGLLLLTAGAREVVRFLPPLTVSEEEVERCLDGLAGALADVYRPAQRSDVAAPA